MGGPYCYDYIASQDLKECDRDVVLALVRTDGSLLENCSEDLRADKQIVRCALSTCSEAVREGRPLYSIPQEFRSDKDIVMAAIEREGPYCYDYIASQELKEHRFLKLM